MTRRREMNEQQVGEIVVAWLEALGADVYQEVECPGGVADVVARVRAELWIVEVKTSFSLALLFQAMERRREAHRVYIAAPYSKNIRDVIAICDELGIGVLEVKPPDPEWNPDRHRESRLADYYAPRVTERGNARRWNRKPVRLASELKPQLKPQHKTHAKAGAIGGGGRWTPFRDTCEQLARVVKAEPGITLKTAVDGIKHHYSSASSARGSLAKWIADGKVPGVTMKKSPAGIAQLWPKDGPT